ncbi:hypothetical protein LSTR_LSTR011884 [Laodelphax striatellus]|uniref:CHK kinase-like domain-containing protein n=1 Tax=Laodelphax striatellus TaxID=195883 RepID=A0A482XR31_LAOST|nr:hypothetical protein LSTR_LSTR011884 [Laodelphax striatellus]
MMTTLDKQVLQISERIISEILANEKVTTVKYDALDTTEGHFTSTVKALEVFVTSISDCENKRTMKLIAKVLENRGNDYLKLAFRKENEFYSSLISVYNSIGLGSYVEASITPNYFGSNILSTDNEPGLILLENLKYSGYRVYPERYFDLDLANFIIYKMSYFHSLGIALKRRNRKSFEEDFKNLIEPALLNSNSVDRSSINLKLRFEIRILLQKRPEMEKFCSRVDALLEKIDNMKIPQPKEPFCTLIHNDLWKNNILIKYHNNIDVLSTIDIKLIDFQFVLYNSPIRDLAYFVFSSCCLEIQKDFRKIAMFYYECFVKNLETLKCDTSEFTESRFIEEVNEYAPTKFKHLILLMKKTPDIFEERLMDLVKCHAENGFL